LKRIIFILFIGLIFSGCDLFIKKDEQVQTLTGKPIARVENELLFIEDLKALELHKLSKEDSTLLSEKYIHNWIKRELLLQKAASAAGPFSEELESNVKKYREDLLLFEYEKTFLKEKLDTVITEKEINDYYKANLANFELKQNIFRGYFIKLPTDAPKIEEAKALIKSDNKKSLQELRSYCLRFAHFYSLEDTIWINFDNLIKETPFRDIENKVDFLEKNRYSERTDGNNLYLIRIKEYKITDQTSPLNFVREQIQSMILTKRKIKLVKELEENIYTNAAKEGDFEIFKAK